MNRSPAFQFYPKDWRDVKVRRMSLAAQGAYWDILCDMWIDSKDQCSLLDCDPFIAKSLGVPVEEWCELRKEIQHAGEPLLIEKDGRLYSSRLKTEAIKQRKFSKKQAENAQKRWDARAMPPHESGISQLDAKSCSSSSSSTSILKNKTPVLNGQQSGFDIFWKAYPRKCNKGRAEKAWIKLQPDEVLLGMMLGKLDQAKQTPQWTKDGGEFIPHPASWLNNKGWEDEFTPARKERLPL